MKDTVFFDAEWNVCDESVAVYSRVKVRNETGVVVETQCRLISRERERAYEAKKAKAKQEQNSMSRFVANIQRKEGSE